MRDNSDLMFFLVCYLQTMSKIKSPCVRNCCLDTHDVCLGCFRSMNEIMMWSKMNTTLDQKRQIILYANKRRQAHKLTLLETQKS